MAERYKVLLDLNNPVFQEDLFNLGKEDALRVLDTLSILSLPMYPGLIENQQEYVVECLSS